MLAGGRTLSEVLCAGRPRPRAAGGGPGAKGVRRPTDYGWRGSTDLSRRMHTGSKDIPLSSSPFYQEEEIDRGRNSAAA